jgi:hypothetical protein
MVLKESVVLSLLAPRRVCERHRVLWLLQFMPLWGDFMTITLSPNLLR